MAEVDKRDVYAVLLHLLVEAENTTWSRFSNFLLFCSVLLVAWATLRTGPDFALREPVLVLICMVGAAGGVFWSVLGYRGRKFHDRYLKMGKEFEEKYVKDIDVKLLPATETDAVRNGFCLSNLASSYAMLVVIPLIFTGIYGFLWWVSLR